MSKKIKIISAIVCASMLLAGCGRESSSTVDISNSEPSASGSAELIIEDGIVTGYTTAVGDIVIPDSVTQVGESAFELSKDITGVTISEGVTTIGSGAFERCSELEKVSFPTTLTTLGDWSFSGCWLETVELPDSVVAIYDTTFSSNRNIQVNYKGNTYGEEDLEELCKAICYNEDGLYVSEDGRLIDCFNTAEGTIVVPETVTIIDTGAFRQCDCLSEIILPEGLTEIGEEAFETCDSLTAITIPDSVTSIGANAFKYCEALMELTIPDGVTYMGDDVFDSCDDIAVTYKGITYTADNMDELYNAING